MALKKLEAQKKEIEELNSELALAKKRDKAQNEEIEELNSRAKKREEEDRLKRKDVESQVIKENEVEALVIAKESHVADSKNNAEVNGDSSFIKQNQKVENAVDEKSVIEKPQQEHIDEEVEKPKQEFKWERHNIDDEVEKVARDDDDGNLNNSLV